MTKDLKIDTRRSKFASELKMSLRDVGGKETSEYQDDDNSLSETSDDDFLNVEEEPGESMADATAGMVTRSRVRTKVDKQPKNYNKNKKRGTDSNMDEEEGSASNLPAPKRRGRRKKQADSVPDYIEVSEEEELVVGKRENMVKVKRVMKGSNEGEIKVVTSYEELSARLGKAPETTKLPPSSPDRIHRTYAGPVNRTPPSNTGIPKVGGRKYMILDKATIKEMMKKGLIQSIKKDGDNQSVASYRAIIPKSGPSVLRRVATAISDKQAAVIMGTKNPASPHVLNSAAGSGTTMLTKQAPHSVEFSPISNSFKTVPAGSPMVSTSQALLPQGHTLVSKLPTMVPAAMVSTSQALVPQSHTMVTKRPTLVPAGHTLLSGGQTLLSSGHTLMSSSHSLMSSSHSLMSSGQTLVSAPIVVTTSGIPTTAVPAPMIATTTVSGIPFAGNALITSNVPAPGTNAVTSTSTTMSQVVTAPLYIRSQVTGAPTSSNQSNVQVVALPPEVLQQLQHLQRNVYTTPHGAPVMTTTTTTVPHPVVPGVKVVTKEIVPTESKMATTTRVLNNDDLKHIPSSEVDGSKRSDEKSKKEDGTYGVPTGVCKVLKSMKMYQYVDESNSKRLTPLMGPNGPLKSTVRWVAVPNNSTEPLPEGGPTFRNVPPPHSKDIPRTSSEKEGNPPLAELTQSSLRRILKEMKLQHARLIGKHRTRFSRLQKKYLELERDYRDVEDVGTQSQLIRDAKEYLSEEHHLFFESQLFINNAEGKGNRFSKKFMKLMLQLYNKSPAGYKYLKTIFTIPSIKALEKLESQGSTATTSPTCVHNGHQQLPEGDSNVSGATDKASTSLEEDLNSANCKKPPKSQMDAEGMSLDLHSETDELMESKSWFKAGSGIGDSLPPNSEQTVFLSEDVKKSFLQSKIETMNSGLDIEEEDMREDEEEEDDKDNPHENDDDDEEEEEEEEPEESFESANNSKADQFELGEMGEITDDVGEISSFDNIAKKVMVVPDNASPVKQDLSINWDETWTSSLME